MKLRVSAVACALFLAAPVAGAIPVDPADAAVSAVDPAATGSIHLEFEAPNPHNDEPGPSHVGIEVDVRRVSDIDLSTNTGWQAASELDIDELLNSDSFDESFSGTTDGNGHVSFVGVPVGLYLVTPVEEGTFVPFAVTLPMTDVSGSTWRYEITAHPKVADDTDPDPEDPEDEDTEKERDPRPDPQPGPSPLPDDDGTSGVAPDDETSESTPREQDGQQSPSRMGLAETGASVIGISLLGTALILLGYFLSRRRSEEDQQ